jgi:hypothetical protein
MLHLYRFPGFNRLSETVRLSLGPVKREVGSQSSKVKDQEKIKTQNPRELFGEFSLSQRERAGVRESHPFQNRRQLFFEMRPFPLL